MEICPKLSQIIARLTLRGKIREFEREMSEVVTEQNQMRLIWVFGDKTFSTLPSLIVSTMEMIRMIYWSGL